MRSCETKDVSCLADMLLKVIADEHGEEPFCMTGNLALMTGLTADELLMSIKQLMESGQLSRWTDEDGNIVFQVQNHHLGSTGLKASA